MFHINILHNLTDAYIARQRELYFAKRLAGVYDNELKIEKYYNNFIDRFFKNQFKRSCLPDGPKVGSVGVSSKVDLILPSDIKTPYWLK